MIVVEIDEDQSPLAAPSSDSVGPGAQRPIGIVALVAAGRPVPAHVDVARSHLPRGGRVVVVRQTERNVMLVQQTEDVIVVPALVRNSNAKR